MRFVSDDTCHGYGSWSLTKTIVDGMTSALYTELPTEARTVRVIGDISGQR